MALSGAPADWRSGTKLAVIRDALDATLSLSHSAKECATCDRIWRDLVPSLGVKPMVYTTKDRESGRMVEMPRGRDRSKRLRAEVYEVHKYLTTATPTEGAPEVPAAAPEPSGSAVDAAAYDRLDEILAAMRKFCSGRGIEGNFVESARSDFNGYRMIAQGIPPEAIATACATTWSADTRAQFTAQTGIPLNFDPCTFGERIDGLHRVTPYLKAAIRANVPVYMHGATGTLKSSGLKAAAADMGLPYYETNLAGQLASAITGRDLLKRFSESAYVKAYRDGGLWAGEEIDKAHPLVLTQINNSIESDEYHNPMLEKPIKRHPNFRIVVNANTPGTGPTKEFNASNKLDDSTQDRFRTGYIKVNRDHVMVRSVLDKIKAEAIA